MRFALCDLYNNKIDEPVMPEEYDLGPGASAQLIDLYRFRQAFFFFFF